MAQFEIGSAPPRVIICGESTVGKTGSLAALANAGYRIFIHDFDNNSRVLGNYLTKEGAARVFIQHYDIGTGLASVELMGAQDKVFIKAKDEMNRFYKQLLRWTADADIPAAAELTSKDVVVVDSGTFLGDLCLKAAELHPEAKRDRRSIYGVAGEFYKRILTFATGPEMGASFVMLTHITTVGEKDAQGNLVNGKAFPSSVGNKLSTQVSSYFTDVWKIDVDPLGKRSILTQGTSRIGLRTSVPAKIGPKEAFDMAAMFQKLGA